MSTCADYWKLPSKPLLLNFNYTPEISSYCPTVKKPDPPKKPTKCARCIRFDTHRWICRFTGQKVTPDTPACENAIDIGESRRPY